MYTDEDEKKMKARKDLFPENFRIETDMRGATALFFAVLNDNFEAVKVLLDHGADPLIKTRSGYHPLEAVDETTDEGLKIKMLLIKAIKSRDDMMKERRKKYPLEARLKESIIGQDSQGDSQFLIPWVNFRHNRY
jgi:ATP-dependent Clp protease ATP-binding subunit ClpB